MKKSLIRLVIVTLIAFLLGFMLPDFLGFSPDGAKAAVTMLPTRLAHITGTPPMRAGSYLPLIATYSRVMNDMNEHYYGKVDIKEVTYDAIRGALASLGDPFTRFIDPEAFKTMQEENQGNFTGIGALLESTDNGEVAVKEPLPDTPAIKAGVKSGDVITEVDGKSVVNMDIDDVVKLIRGEENTTVKLTVRRGEEHIVISIVRKVVQTQTVTFKMQDEKDKIGYIRLYQFNEQADTKFTEAYNKLEKQGMKALIFDLRGNPGGLLDMAVRIGSDFVKKGDIVIIRDRGGKETAIPARSDRTAVNCPVVVLVDGSSASASEIVSGAIKDYKVGTLVGEKTFGKGLVQTLLPMIDGSATAITTSKYLTPNKIDIHKKGIEPDIKVKLGDDFDNDKPETDDQLQAGLTALRVQMKKLPASALDKYKQKEEKKDEKKEDKKEDKK